MRTTSTSTRRMKSVVNHVIMIGIGMMALMMVVEVNSQSVSVGMRARPSTSSIGSLRQTPTSPGSSSGGDVTDDGNHGRPKPGHNNDKCKECKDGKDGQQGPKGDKGDPGDPGAGAFSICKVCQEDQVFTIKGDPVMFEVSVIGGGGGGGRYSTGGGGGGGGAVVRALVYGRPGFSYKCSRIGGGGPGAGSAIQCPAYPAIVLSDGTTATGYNTFSVSCPSPPSSGMVGCGGSTSVFAQQNTPDYPAPRGPLHILAGGGEGGNGITGGPGGKAKVYHEHGKAWITQSDGEDGANGNKGGAGGDSADALGGENGDNGDAFGGGGAGATSASAIAGSGADGGIEVCASVDLLGEYTAAPYYY